LNPRLLKDQDFVLNACARPIPPTNTTWVDIPAHVGYSRLVLDASELTNGIVHKGKVPFILRAITARALPASLGDVYWRMRFANGRYFQNELTAHRAAFGIGSNRQVFLPEVIWNPGEKIFIDLNTQVALPGDATVVMMFEGVFRSPITGAANVINPLYSEFATGPNGDIFRYFQNENQNIMAPEFRFGAMCESDTPPGYWDEEYRYVSPTADLPTAGGTISNVPTQIEPGSDFYCREIWPYFPGGANQGFGTVVCRMRRGDGYALSSNFLPINTIQGPMFPELKIKATDTITYDAYIVGGGGGAGTVLTFGLYFMGVRRRKL
jgi:hypothetical protein